MSALPLAGWVPIRLIWQGAEPIVEWCHLERERFTHPFFDTTIQLALESPFNRLFRHHTTMAALEDWSRRSPGATPTGFIFHLSRCGSTVISQTLASLEESVVISEAGPLDALARAHLRAPALGVEQRAAWLQWMVSALGQHAGEGRYFIKFDARTTLELPLLARAFPEVPWIFVYRDPVEVLVSLLRRPSAMTIPGMGPLPPGLELAEAAAMAPAEYAARVLGMVFEAATGALSAGRGMAVNYREIPGAVWDRVAWHFGLELNALAVERMKAAAAPDAKDRSRLFQADSAQRRAEATEEIRRAAEEWVAPRYEELERLRGQASV